MQNLLFFSGTIPIVVFLTFVSSSVLAMVVISSQKRAEPFVKCEGSKLEIVNDLSLEPSDLVVATDRMLWKLVPSLNGERIPRRSHHYSPVWDQLYMEELRCRVEKRQGAGLATPEQAVMHALSDLAIENSEQFIYEKYRRNKPLMVTPEGDIILGGKRYTKDVLDQP